MYRNIVHNRNIADAEAQPHHIVFEEEDWYRTDAREIGEFAEEYAGIGFSVGTIEALDDTMLVVMYKPEGEWRVIQTRNG